MAMIRIPRKHLTAVGLVLTAALMTGCAIHTGDSKEKGGVYKEPARPIPADAMKVSAFSPLQMLLPYVKKHGGKMTRDQFRNDLKDAFHAADKDGDGQLNKKEMRAVNDTLWKQYGAGTTPLQDWNGDGYIDFEEYGGTPWTLFTDLDRDHDNILTLKEVDPFANRKKPKKHKRDERPPLAHPPSPRN